MRDETAGDKVSDVVCEYCNSENMIRVWPEELNISVTFGEFKDRAEKQDDDRQKRVKDYDRSMKNRKKSFGSQNVNVSKSELAKRDHKIKKEIVPQQGGKTTDIDKTEFVKMAAKNPNAVKAAQNVINKRKG